MSKRFAVRAGQRYVQRHGLHYRPAVWRVGSVRPCAAALPHALLVNVDDPLQTKTISCTTLTDRVYYELLSEAPGATA